VLPKKTLATLEKYNIPRDKIFIFVVQEELEEYRASCPGYNVIVGRLGLVSQREFIEQYFPLDSQILFMDDDIEDVFEVKDPKTRSPLPSLSDFIDTGFKTMTESGGTLWGVYPVNNCMYAFKNKKMTTKLNYIVGAFYGQKNTRDIYLTHGDSVEDRERTILRFNRDGCVVRFNHIGLKTKYFAKGGLMSDTRQKEHQISSEALVAKWPSMLRLKVRKNLYVDCQVK
jgi:hypothetical protein